MTLRTRLLSCTLGVSLLLPSFAFARPINQIVSASSDTVSRADFLSWSMEVLSIEKSKEGCTLSYVRYPRRLKSTLCAAQREGVLDVFGQTKTYPLGKIITRVEALQVLTALLNKQETSDISSFKEVMTPMEKQAVMNAVALKWMQPARANLFGAKRPLRGSEAIALLTAVSGQDKMQHISISIDVTSSDTGSLPKQELFNAIWQIINRDFLRTEKIDPDELAYKALDAMVSGLGDPYTNFFRPAVASDFQSQIKGDISGIGAQIELKSGALIVVAPLPGSPAEKAGILSGDQIIQADSTVLIGLPLDKAVSYIRGEKGTFVTLKILRGGVSITVRVKRELISIPEIQVRWQGDIAVVQLVQFGETTEKQIRSVFSDISKQNPHGIILDLRNNGGGLLTAADTVVSNFMPKGTVVASVQSKMQTTQEITQDEPIIDSKTKLVVLVNKGSASAAEIVAGALQDHKRATIVGTQTFGKGTVQEVLGFRSGEALKITIAEWLTPLGRKLDAVGVKPDVVVEKTSDRDDQLARALDILR